MIKISLTGKVPDSITRVIKIYDNQPSTRVVINQLTYDLNIIINDYEIAQGSVSKESNNAIVLPTDKRKKWKVEVSF